MMCDGAFQLDWSGEDDPLDAPLPSPLETAGTVSRVETESAFFARRALEESRLAQSAATPSAAAAHRYLAAAYSALLAREKAIEEELERLALRID